jgi:pyruvate/2-oxoglutarate dehydrogenase complex dihydrolipoamide dehydrogenase (E3) component
VVILGGGAIGVEFASVWRSFVVEVTIVEMLPHLLSAEEESSSKLLERALRRRGISYQLGARFEGVKESDEGVTVTLEGGKTLDAELLLVAVGRAPVSEGLGYEAAGVTVDRGFVQVDGYCRTSVPTISAVGDLTPRLQLAHVGFAEGILVAERVSGLPVTPIGYDGVPRITYSDPEVASVGITSATAARRGIETTEFTYNLGGNGKSVILQTQGRRRSSLPRARTAGRAQFSGCTSSAPGPVSSSPRASSSTTGRRRPHRSRSSSTPTRPSPRPSARLTWRSPGSPARPCLTGCGQPLSAAHAPVTHTG